MSNINNNNSVVNVGRTTPVSPGQQPANRSIPVVLASDQSPIPVEEQNKVQSEVSLSLLGIPRSEVALGIFADVNTYDVNPMEWSSNPQFHTNGFGIKHLPTEAGALVEAPRNKKAVLTSKRFFRYQPGRVSAATFGIKSTVSTKDFAVNPVIRKYGIFDNFDGYYWESKQSGQGDNFSVVRRTQSLLNFPVSPFGNIGDTLRTSPGYGEEAFITRQQTDDYRSCGKGWSIPKTENFLRERQQLEEAKVQISLDAFEQAMASANVVSVQDGGSGESFSTFINSGTDFQVYERTQKCHRDVQFWIDFYLADLEWGGNAHTLLNTKNYRTALVPDRFQEKLLHGIVKEIILNLIDNTSPAWLKLNELTDVPLAMFDAPLPRNYWQTLFASVTPDYGTKNPLETIFDVRKVYWAYFVSTYSAGIVGANYSNTEIHSTATHVPYYYEPVTVFQGLANLKGIDLIDALETLGRGYFRVNDTVNGTTLVSWAQAYHLNDYVDNIKQKCARDMIYVIDGYKNDILGGGNAETRYNMSMYYRGSGQSIFSQFTGGIASEISRHTHLKDLILSALQEEPYAPADPVVLAKIQTLSSELIANFNIESTLAVDVGGRGFAGNLVTFRDGLPMIHAAVNDPNLLKDAKKIKTHTRLPFVENPNDYPAQWENKGTIFTLTEGHVTYGQKVRVYTETGEDWGLNTVVVGSPFGGWRHGDIYTVDKVLGQYGNEFTLRNPDGDLMLTVGNDGSDLTAATNSFGENWVYVELVVPFLTPTNYDPLIYRTSVRPAGTITTITGGNVTTAYDEASDPFIKGMQWPLKYSSGVALNDSEAVYLGEIDTTLDPNDTGDLVKIRQQYDDINFNPEYINWIKNNVKPEFWGVYEYRVPRSRFSHDKLDGQVTKRVYSDKATGPTGIVRPGQNALDDDGIWQDAVSLYEFDFTKVTMLKIEFSWYGAVGALFLAYVPVGNGEARWVRVHHLRASNQLKIASLGNATLPITYNVWGGGDVQTGGDLEEQTDSYNYGNPSHHIVKYGASYYIDGGDRGTVRLYSHNNNDVVNTTGKQWVVANNSVSVTEKALTDIGNTTDDGVTIPNDLTYFMGAELRTSDRRDKGIKVTWADSANNTLEFSRQPFGTGATLITDRATIVYGLETKDIIYSSVEGQPVRNRVQVYPTKLSTANLGDNPVRLRMKKTPVFQTTTAVLGTLTLTEQYNITAANLPLPVSESDGVGSYMLNNESIYGWFKGRVLGSDATIFGRLYKELNQHYFEMLESYTDTVTLLEGYFLPDGRFGYDTDGNVVNFNQTSTKQESQIDTLSSINIVDNSVVPIPNTGINIATLYLTPGTEQLDLYTYFDYNKEYLSYPLTDVPESLYFAVDSDTSVSGNTDPIAIGLTWEEQ